MWRRFRRHGQSSRPNDSIEDGKGSSIELGATDEQQISKETPIPLKEKSKSPPLKIENELQTDGGGKQPTRSRGTSTSKKSFWRDRVLSSPTTKRTEQKGKASRKLSRSSKSERISSTFTVKSGNPSLTPNPNPKCFDNDIKENEIHIENTMTDISKSSRGVRRATNRKNDYKSDIITISTTSTSHSGDAPGAPEEVVQIRNPILHDGPWHADPAVLTRQFSAPTHSNQSAVMGTSRSISAPFASNIPTVHVANPTFSDMRARPSVGNKSRVGRPSRFSLRRLFYGNTLAQPAILRTFAPTVANEVPSTSKAINKGNVIPTRFVEDNHSDTKSTVWRDNTSTCSSLQGGAAAAISLGGNSTAASLMAVAGGSSSSTVLKECPLCLSECTLDLFPLLRNCHHLFCIDCLQTYVRIEIQEGRVNLRCPQCTELMHPNDIETLIGDKNSNLLTLYESLMLRRLLAVDPDTRWCPGPNCTYAVIAAGCASCPKITCERPGCGYSFCYHCKAEWHPNQTCDAARAHRNQNQMVGPKLPIAIRSSSGTFSLDSAAINAAGGAVAGSAAGVINSGGSIGVASNGGGQPSSEVKVCPRCNTLIVKMDDGSCNHMTCPVCGAEFCWLCMKEISDLHYLSPSGCTFWGKKPWSRKKKLLWQLGTLVGAPVGIVLLAGIAIPAMIIGIPSWVGRKIHDHYKLKNKHKRNLAVVGGVISSLIISPFLAGLAVSIGVPILLCYVYGVVPIALCRSEGCGVYTTVSGVRIDIDEEDIDMANAATQLRNAVMTVGENAAASFRNMKSSGNSNALQSTSTDSRNLDSNDENRKTLNIGVSRGHRHQDLVANPSIGEVSLGNSLSMGSGCHLNEREEQETDQASRECDRESASNTAMAGASLTGSLASSYFGVRSTDPNILPNSQRQDEGNKSAVNQSSTTMSGIGTYHLQNRLEVDVHNGARKKFSFSSERLSETISLSERSGTISLADGDGARSEASTRALAGSLLAYKLGDSQSVGSYHRVIGERAVGDPTSETTSNVVPASSSSMGYGTSVVGEDALSLRSLPLHPAMQGRVTGVDMFGTAVGKEQQLPNPSSSSVSVVPPRSLSPVSSMSGDELSYVPTLVNQHAQSNSLFTGLVSAETQAQGGSKRFSRRQRAMLDKQLSENSSLLGEADTISERVRFDDNVSFIDAEYITLENTNPQCENITTDELRVSESNCQTNTDGTSIKSHEFYSYDNTLGVGDDTVPTLPRVIKGNIIDPSCIVTEETAEELAQVVSPPVMRSHMQSPKLSQTLENRSTEATEDFVKIKNETLNKVVVTTKTGNSIVLVNQHDCFQSGRTLGATGSGDGSTSPTLSKSQEMCILKHEDSSAESPKYDHITLVTVGDMPDTQLQTEHL